MLRQMKDALEAYDAGDPSAPPINGSGNALREFYDPPMPEPRYDSAPLGPNTMRFESGPDAGRVVDLAPSGAQQKLAQWFGNVRSGGGSTAPSTYEEGPSGGGMTWNELAAMNPAWGPQPPEQPADLQSDFSRPIEIAGVGKGYYAKGGGGRAIINGQEHLLGVDRKRTRDNIWEEQQRQFVAAKARQGLHRGEVDMAKDLEQIAASRAGRIQREDPNTQAMLEKRFGKADKDTRWRPDGTLEPIPGGQRNQDAKDVLGILDMAEPLVGKATGSYGGTAVDELGRFFGMTSPEADAAAQLKALQGMLVSKMPKMAGPQSDKDVMLYKEMAGRIGDATVPPGQKRAAMNVIRQLNERYATFGGVATSAIGVQGSPVTREAAITELRRRGVVR